MSGGSRETQTQTTSGAPWGPAQGYLKDAMKDASKLLDSGSGFQAYPGRGWVPFSGASEKALAGIAKTARQGNPFYDPAKSLTKGLLGGQFDADTSGFQGLLDNYDPEFDNVVRNTANDLGDQISRQFGGGASYGSAAHTGTIADQVGDVVSRMRSDHFDTGQNFKRGIYGDIASLGQADVQNRLAGLAAAPGVYDMQYAPYDRLAEVGAAREGKAAEELQSKMDKWYINNMSDWDRLTQAFGIYSGTGAQGNRATTTLSQPSDPWSKILGGGLLASQLFGLGG